MKVTWQIFKKHPVTLVFYVLYILLCLDTFRILSRFRDAVKAKDSRINISWGEGVTYSTIFTFLIGIAFLLIIVANAAIRSKDQTPFYVWIMAFIIIPMIALAAY